MKSKLVVALLSLGAVLFAMEPLTGQTPPPSLAGSWQLTMLPGNPNAAVTEPTIYVLATFTSDGSMIESDSSEVVSIPPSARSGLRAATAGHGIWQPAPAFGNLFIQFISLVVNQNATLYGRKTVTIIGALDTTGNNFSGSYSYVLVDPNGGLLATGSGTVTGQRIPHPVLP
jgi:hypothetical protein